MFPNFQSVVRNFPPSFRHIFPLLFLPLLLAACQTQNTAVPRFDKGDCPFTPPSGISVECGFLVVPEIRSAQAGQGAATPAPGAAGGNTLRLAVAIYKTKAANPAPDPIVYLEGGPGGSALRAYGDVADKVFGPFMAQRDLILVDQRGTGYSQPALDCPEVIQEEVDVLPLDLSAADADQRSNTAFEACRDRLVKAGVNLAAYNSAESAADFEDLRQVLGYKQWNLYGVSYGTRLALEILRQFPQGVRSTVIDGNLPPQVDKFAEQPGNTVRALNELFDSCAADTGCNATYPNLKTVFYDTVKKLNQTPVKVQTTLPDMGIQGLSGKQVDFLINGDSLVGVIFQALYVTSFLPELPQVIYQASQGDLSPVAQLNTFFMASDKDTSWGMYMSVNCAEEVPFSNEAAFAAALKQYPELGDSQGTPQGPFDLCKAWGVPAAPASQDQPVKSDVPTLVISEQFDPVTPPAWGKLVASTLSKSTFIEFPDTSHGASVSEDCPRRAALTFFDNPAAAPSPTCIKDMTLPFSGPGQSVKVDLVPFDNSTLGISGLVPNNWRPVSGVPGLYSPTGDATDPSYLMLLSQPVTAEQYLQFMKSQFQSMGIVLNSTGQTRATPNGLTFTLYSGGYALSQMDLAIAESNNHAYVVLMQSPFSQHDALYASIFQPAIDSLKPR